MNKYLENAQSVLPTVRKLFFQTKIDLPSFEKAASTDVVVDENSKIRFIELQMWIYARILRLIDDLVNCKTECDDILNELHRLNNKTYIYSLHKQTIDFQYLDLLPGFEHTDVFNIQDILSKISNINYEDLLLINEWSVLMEYFKQHRKLKVFYFFYFILFFFVIYFAVVMFGNVYLLVPTIILTVLSSFKAIPISIIKVSQPIRYTPRALQETEIVAVIIPIIYKNFPDYKEILEQVDNISNSEKFTRLDIYLLADESDSKSAQSEEYWQSQFDKINEQLISKSDHELDTPKIHLWLRKHEFNKYDKVYMGYERKRGKVEEFVKWTRGLPTKSQIFTDAKAKQYKYAFVIDEGMSVSQNCISQLLGILSHPANTPIISNGQVKDGYAIAQPKSFGKVNLTKTKFQQFFDSSSFVNFSYGEDGDVITELSRNANFNGKGLLNLDIFAELLLDIFPENLVLSHDLLEGSKCRVVNDNLSKVFETFPDNFFSYLNRENRWMRGDINAIFFALPKFSYNGKTVRFQMDTENRIRMVLNFVNILKNICELLYLIFAPQVFLALIIIFVLRSLSSLLTLVRTIFSNLIKFRKISVRYTLFAIFVNFDLLNLLCIANIFLIFVSAVSALVKSIFRLFSGKLLLEWTSFKQQKSFVNNKFDILIASISIVVFFIINPYNTMIVFVLTIIVIYFDVNFSKNYKNTSFAKEKELLISKFDREYLTKIVADTYSGLRNKMIDVDSFLPVDNVDKMGIHDNSFTSITNIGMYLLSLCSVHKLLIISEREFVTSLTGAMDQISKLPTQEGNYFNWYDLSTNSAVWGGLVSSVDLGNFHISLICTFEYLKEITKTSPELSSKIFQIIVRIGYSKFVNKFEELSVSLDPEGRRVETYYNIWASETRIASFMAIATGSVLDRHWYSLERLQSYDGVYLSWGGGSFEYLLPAIFFHSESQTLEKYTFDKYLKLSIKESSEIDKKYPWGQSESFYLDDEGQFLYGPNGLNKTSSFPQFSKYFVVVPYASALCAMIDSQAVLENFRRIEKFGGRGEFGFFESVSFYKDSVIITEKYMAHHQGMIIASITNLLTDGYIQKLFSNSPQGSSLQYLHNSNINQIANVG